MQGRPEARRAHASARCSLPRPYQGNPTFDPEFIRSKSTAAAGLCSWCINIVRFYEVYCDVAPKRQALEEANAELAEAQEKLSRIKNKIAVSAGWHRSRASGPRSVPRRGGAGRGGAAAENHSAQTAPAAAGTRFARFRASPSVFPGTQCQPEQPNVGLRKGHGGEDQVPAGGGRHQQGDLAGEQVAHSALGHLEGSGQGTDSGGGTAPGGGSSVPTCAKS